MNDWTARVNDLSAEVVDAIVRASWQGAIVIGIVWLVCLIWRRIPSTVRCALWLFVCLKLLLALVPNRIAIPCLPSSPPPQVSVGGSKTPANVAKLFQGLPDVVQGTSRSLQSPESRSPASWLAVIWVLGVAFTAVRSGRQFAKSWRLVRGASTCTDPSLIEAVEDLSRTLRLRTVPKVKVTDRSTAVLAFGALRPIILISSETLVECTAAELRMVLAHELAHIRRRDAWQGLIPLTVQTLFFFHPLAWLACREFEFSREAACDEDVISSLQIGAGQYGHLLVKLGSPKASVASLCTPGVSSHFRMLRRRIVMLDRTKNGTPLQAHRRPLALVSMVATLCILPISLVQGQKSAPTPTPVKTTSNTAAKSPPKPGVKRPVPPARKSAEVSKPVSVAPSIPPIAKPKADKVVRSPAATPFIPKDPQSVTVYSLKHADTGKLLQILHTLYGEPSRAVVKVAADERTNSIIVTAPQNRATEVADLISQLDVPTPEVAPGQRKVIRVITVHRGDAAKIVPMVNAILKKDAPEYISASSKDNSILVRTTEDNCNLVQQLVNLLEWRVTDPSHPQ